MLKPCAGTRHASRLSSHIHSRVHIVHNTPANLLIQHTWSWGCLPPECTQRRTCAGPATVWKVLTASTYVCRPLSGMPCIMRQMDRNDNPYIALAWHIILGSRVRPDPIYAGCPWSACSLPAPTACLLSWPNFTPSTQSAPAGPTRCSTRPHTALRQPPA